MPFIIIPNYQLIQIQQPSQLAELQISDLITNSRMKPIFFIIIINCWLKAIIPSEENKLDAWKKNLAKFCKRITVCFLVSCTLQKLFDNINYFKINHYLK